MGQYRGPKRAGERLPNLNLCLYPSKYRLLLHFCSLLGGYEIKGP